MAIVHHLAIVLAVAFAAADRTLPGALLGRALFDALLGIGHTLFAGDLAVDLIEIGHDIVMTLSEFGGARLVGVLRDGVEASRASWTSFSRFS
jgi:hypothetical protein